MFLANKLNKGGGAAGYQISRSLRFNSADSAYLNRTPATTTNRTTWTWSGWVKRASFGSSQVLFGAGPDGSNYTIFYFSGTVSENLEIFNYTGGVTTGYAYTNSVFRDPSAWYHVVLAVDTTQGTSADRTKIYVNNVLQPITISTAFGSSLNTWVNTNNNHRLGSTPTTSALYGGYMTEVNFIDGTALTPSSFGETNAQTGVWQPKAYSGSYGTNGFYLNFSDNSNTTDTTLGKDYSGNGNNWTPTGFLVSTGPNNDSLVDSPTSYGTDTGVGGTVRGNYCTLNPLAKASAATLSNGNLDAVGTTSWTWAMTTFAVTSGKWYWEVTHTNGGVDNLFCGIAKTTFQNFTYNLNPALSDSYNVYGYTSYLGNKEGQGADTAYGSAFQTAGDIVGVALDMDAGTLTFYKNGVSQGQAFSGITVQVCPVWGGVSASVSAANMNFGQRAFAYTAPSGFKALCTQNLPTPTIGATTATQANLYFTPNLRVGTGASGSTISTTVNMANGALLWDKSRSAAGSHYLVDSVRGISNTLSSDSTGAEASFPSWFTNFGTNSYTVGSSDWSTGITVVDWIWAANGSGSTNTAGTITSTVSANTTSGFSVVTYTGTGANATVGHGLGVAPSMIIIKNRSTSSYDWMVYHTSIGNTKYLRFNQTDAEATSSSAFNNTSPTSTVFSLGNGSLGNQSTYTYVAYCFAEVAGYSKFGSYTGNGSADGTFVYTGFRPACIIFKVSDGAASWLIHDNKRNTNNVVDKKLFPNLSDAEATADVVDFLSNGFKLRGTNTQFNGNGYNYIFAAFAENPFKFSLAR
jgi:hypothetical protein